MEDWEIWLTIAGIVVGTFCFLFIIVYIYRKRRHQKIMSNLIQTRYSVNSSRYSFKSFIAIPWRLSTDTIRSSVQPVSEISQPKGIGLYNGNTNSCFNPNGSTSAVQGTKPLNSQSTGSTLPGLGGSKQPGRSSRGSSHHSMTLEIIREYEEKENELGLGTHLDPEADR